MSTLNDEQTFILKVLSDVRGDDLARAQRVFKTYTPKQMNEEYGESGRTPQEIIDSYVAYEAKVTRVIEWVRKQNP